MVKRMKKALKRGWNVYTDMESIKLEGVRVIKVKDLKDHIPPPNSHVFLEEVGLTFDNRKFKEFDDGYNRLMKYLRKYRLRMDMNSQAFDVDVKIRNLTDSMVLCASLLNCISIVRPIRRSVTLTAPTGDTESRIADRLEFDRIWNWQIVWMPKYFKYFDSFDADKLPLIDYREVLPLDYEVKPDYPEISYVPSEDYAEYKAVTDYHESQPLDDKVILPPADGFEYTLSSVDAQQSDSASEDFPSF